MSGDITATCEAIVSQVHVPDFDVQGHLQSSEKLELVEFGIEHLRAFNPHAYIVMSGHGHRPRNLSLCDYAIWNDNQEPLNEHGYVVGMPAQFKYVSKALEHIRSKGYKYVLKTRGDCVVGIPNIGGHCRQILGKESRRLLLTQQTGPERMGDCFMYGETPLMCKIWSEDNPVFHADGLQNTAHHFRRALCKPIDDWRGLLKRTCAFRDVDLLKFACLRWNYRGLGLDESVRKQFMDPDFDFSPYHWGRVQGWHHFDADRNMSGSGTCYWSQKEFYE